MITLTVHSLQPSQNNLALTVAVVEVVVVHLASAVNITLLSFNASCLLKPLSSKLSSQASK